MGNRANIDTMEQVDFKTREVNYAIHIYDDYKETTIFVAKEDIDCDDMDVLRNLIRAKNQWDIHGSSCDIIVDLLDFVEKNARGMGIANEWYDADALAEVFKYDFRNLYKCPKCSWESYDEDSTDCPRCGDGTEMKFIEEEYEK